MDDAPTKDRRIQKTRTLLLEAIGALVHEKPYEQIVIKEILHHANVGRSTFYEHFRDKDELLSGAMRDLLRRSLNAGSTGSRAERMLRFSRPIFEHIEHRRNAAGLDTETRAKLALHERLKSELAQPIVGELELAVRECTVPHGGMPNELLARHVSSSFVMVLDWWVEGRSRLTAAEVDSLFRALALPALSQALGR